MKSQQQQLLLGQTGQSLMLPKMAIKSEKQGATSSSSSSSSSGKSHAYGIPLTPPSSLPSDDSEGNLSPEHLYAPLSPNASVSISAVGSAATNGDSISNGSARRAAAAMTRAAANNNGASNTATSTRQPIHTPLISSQPVRSQYQQTRIFDNTFLYLISKSSSLKYNCKLSLFDYIYCLDYRKAQPALCS